MVQSEYLQTAIQAAQAAEAVIRRYYLSNLSIAIKADHSPVTVADVETEKAIKDIILQAFRLGRKGAGRIYERQAHSGQ